ncbi:MAG: adenylate/guanylate cyclase domain-containing protein [Reyranella sp.]|jgi:adenylate cyclase|nr:adenylate/guanylate cyclase domain-containing protein [Reyranella sp.]MBL6650328.1 adenylate/guanylate cyclase domain-containing protein [Reyranella sp.]
MADDRVKRRLTTVLCADVHGYSRLMEADESGTLATLRRHRTAMAGLIERHDGRVVNTWGDAVIAEFASVVEAVQCAVEIQQEVSSQDPGATPAPHMRFRIGINLGDVMVEGDDIYGDGVNIAARLQELAEPGGILVSGPVYDQVHNKLSVGFDPLGQQQMKNVAPVTTYRVAIGGDPVERRAVAGGESHASRGDISPPPSTPMGAVLQWFSNLPRDVTTLLVIAAFLVLINVFTGLRSVWFHWPVAALLFIAILRTLRRRRPDSGRKEDR